MSSNMSVITIKITKEFAFAASNYQVIPKTSQKSNDTTRNFWQKKIHIIVGSTNQTDANDTILSSQQTSSRTTREQEIFQGLEIKRHSPFRSNAICLASSRLVERHSPCLDKSFTQEVNEERVKTNKKLRCEIEQ
ncbi:hypothetical protein Glove_120g190 [Diversispora epigaea]|uniref:Uncharacterized protein n=1 Tax=Diversispora epigaea TaxID=1348612 RepID=A0A397J9J2_9GLOM|nr:hypothetical protein Glove_120g190 [Diversispora epigaea]